MRLRRRILRNPANARVQRQSNNRGLVYNGNDAIPVDAGVGGRNSFFPSNDMKQHIRDTANFLSLKVKNTTNAPLKVPILDPSGGYQLMVGTGVPAGIQLSSPTTNYQYLINRLARFDLQITHLQLQLIQGSVTQFSNTILTYGYRVDFDAPIPLGVIHPTVYQHSGQNNPNIIDYFEFPETMDQSTTLVTTIEANTCIVFNFKLQGEWGRTL